MKKESIDEKEKEGYEEIFTGQTDLTKMVDTFDMSLKMYLKDAAKIYDRPQLDMKTRELCTISALMSLGVAPDFILHDHLSIAVSIATVQEVRELIVQAYWITGWPSLMKIFNMFNNSFTYNFFSPYQLKTFPNTSILLIDLIFILSNLSNPIFSNTRFNLLSM